MHVHTRLDRNRVCLGNSTLAREQLNALISATGLSEAEITAQEKTISTEKYAKLFVKYVELFTDISVIAVTNHNTGEELDTLIEEAKSCSREITILPGVEVASSHGIHILCLFDPLTPWHSSWKDSIDHFLTEIGITGERFNSQGQPVNAPVTSQKVLEIAEKKGGICVFAHIGTQNGLFCQSSTASGGTAHVDIYKHTSCQIVQLQHTAAVPTGIGNIINGGDPHYGNKRVAQVKCSDAKKLTDIGSRFVWIKANPTFEGLRQIIFEPQERVRIKDEKPEPKSPYFVIDKVRFIDNTSKNDFSSDYIPLNQNINTVIGGKSTGKSLLLYYIAKAIDEGEVKKAAALGDGDIIQGYSFDEDVNFDFEVVWKDGEKTNLRKLPSAEEGENRRKVIYIPQRYLNLLSEREIQSKQTLNSFIQSIILEDENAARYFEQKTAEISKSEKEISKEVNNLFSIEDDIERLNEEIKNTGDEKGIVRYIEQLKMQIESVKAKTGLSKEELQKYETLTGEIKTIEEANNNLAEDKKHVEEFGSELKTRLDVDDLMEEYQDYFTDALTKKHVSENFDFIGKLKLNVDAATEKVVSLIDSRIKDNNKAFAALTKELAPFVSRVEMQAELEQKQQLLKKEEGKIGSIQIKKKNLKVKRKMFDSKKEAVLKLYEGIFAFYEELQSEFKKYSARLKDIDLNIVIGFNDAKFNQEVVEECLNKIDLKKLPHPIASWSEELKYDYNPQTHLQFISSVFDGVLSRKVKTKGRTVKDALLKLFENRFYTDFRISYKNDSLDKMSPGKKGLVLLKILIDLSNAESPIILDQPEDDLDNRSVYTDLVTFIKDKKKERQIIIATHNPNLVVGADAEEVVVANQSGQDIGRDNARYRFEYVSGALEDSFRDEPAVGVLNKMGIRQHVCDVLEGGEEAFQKREQKYDLPNR